MAACCSTRDGQTLVVGYVRAESEKSSVPVDIAQICFHFFGDFSHLIGRRECVSWISAPDIRCGRWYIDDYRGPDSGTGAGSGFSAQVKDLKQLPKRRPKRPLELRRYQYNMVMPHRGCTEVKSFSQIRCYRVRWFRQAFTSKKEYMLRYWFSNPRFYCKYCGFWLDGQKCSISKYEECNRHKGNYLNIDWAVLEIKGSLTMQVRVSTCKVTQDKLGELHQFMMMNPDHVVMMTVVSGPRWTKDKVELVQCVVDGRAL